MSLEREDELFGYDSEEVEEGREGTGGGREGSPTINALRASALKSLKSKNQSTEEGGSEQQIEANSAAQLREFMEETARNNQIMMSEIAELKRQLVDALPAKRSGGEEMEVDEEGQSGVPPPTKFSRGKSSGSKVSKSKAPAQDRLEEIQRKAREAYQASHPDMIKFPRLDVKLTQDGDIGFRLWKLNIIDAIEAQECAFLLDGLDVPVEYINNERTRKIAVKKVKVFIMQHLDAHFQEQVGNLSEPLEILNALEKLCEPTGKAFLGGLMWQLIRLNFESTNETPIEFANRFDKLVRKIREINEESVNETFLKQVFTCAIRSTQTYQKELMYEPGYSVSQLKNMLIEEFNAKEQMSIMDRSLQSGTMLTAGSKPNRGRKLSRRGGPVAGRGGGNRRGGSSFPSSLKGTSSGKMRRQVTCYNCNKHGHTRKECHSRLRKCYNCKEMSTHIAAECTRPRRTRTPSPHRAPNKSSTSKKGKESRKGSSNQSKLVKMKMGDAKKLQVHLARLTRASALYIAGDDMLPDHVDTWVVLDEEQEQEAALLNYSRERSGQAALHVSGGMPLTTFRAVIDSGATEHLANRKEYFEELKPFAQPKRFTCANKDVQADLICEYYGDILIMNNGKPAKLKNVLFAPDLAVNLFSLRKAAGAGMAITFTNDKATFHDPKGSLIKEGEFSDCYWWIEFELQSRRGSKRKIEEAIPCPCLEQSARETNFACSTNHSAGHTKSLGVLRGALVGGRELRNEQKTGRTNTENSNSKILTTNLLPKSKKVIPVEVGGPSGEAGGTETRVDVDRKIEEVDLQKLGEKFSGVLRDNKEIWWHVRLNHASRKYLEAAARFIPEMKGVKFTDRILDCEDCAQAKVVRKPHTEVRKRVDKPFVVLHSDLIGPIKPLNFRNQAKYIVTFMCDFTRFVFAYTLKDKTGVHEALRECLGEIFRITNERGTVHTIRTDAGLEYKTVSMRELLVREGIKVVTSEPYTPQLNGAAERLNRELITKIRVNLLSAKMPFSFWGHALSYVVHVYNRLPHAANDFVSPYEALYGHEPSMKYVKRFGCLAMVVDPKPKTKFAPRGRKAYLLECGETGYVLFDEEHKTLVRSCDVRCIEHIVYGDRIKDYPRPLAEMLEIESEDNPTPAETLRRSLSPSNGRKQERTLYTEPNSFREIAMDPNRELWLDAIRDELESLEENGTWEFVPKSELKSGTKIIKARWVHKRKIESDGSFRYKSRLVAKGFADTNQYDVSEIYAPVARLTDVRLILSIANKQGLVLRQLDVKTAFLHGELEKPVFMEIPEGVVELTSVSNNLAETHVCRLVKSLYGLKVSPKLWYKKFRSVLQALGFIVYEFQKCMFQWRSGNTFILLLIYVDDCLLASNCEKTAKEMIKKIAVELDINDLGSPKKFLGMEIHRDLSRTRTFVSQEKFISELLEKYLIEGDKVSNLPMFPKSNTLSCQLDNSGESPRVPYREVIGSLLYLQNCTRPDISFAVNFLSRKQVGYTAHDWDCVQKVLQYLNGTRNLGISFVSVGTEIECYSDASLGTNDPNGKSTTGFALYAFGDLIAWKSKKQRHVSMSSSEAEYLAMSSACRELISVRATCKFLTGEDKLTTLYCDCKPAISLAKTDESRTLKHIVKLSYHLVRNEYNSGNLNIEWVGTNEQVADLLTKPLPKDKFEEFRSRVLT